LEASIALLRAFKDVRNEVFGRYDSASQTSYVVDPTDGTLWDLKPVLGLTLEHLGVDVSRGHITHELARLCRKSGVDVEQVVFSSRASRPLGMRINQVGLNPVDWSQVVEDQERITASSNYYLIKQYNRNSKVVDDALALAKGVCQACKMKAPFNTLQGIPFLEVHHIVPLSLGGPDILKNVVALCPNCHRKQHFGIADTF
jgi:5-methylcytosine-specific restriction protein A